MLLILGLIPAHSLQMDLRLKISPKEEVRIDIDEIKSEPEDIKSEPEDIKSEPEDIPGEPKNVTSKPKEINGVSDEIKSEPDEIKSEPEDIKSEPEDLTSRPNCTLDEIKSEPEDIKSEPEDIQSEPEDIPGEPKNVTSKPKEINGVSDEIKSEPDEIKSEPEDIKSEPEDITSRPNCTLEEIKSEPEDIKSEPEDIPSKPKAINSTLDEIKSEPEDIKSEPEDLSGKTNVEDAVARHFAASLLQFTQYSNLPKEPISNGFHPQSRPNAFVPFKRFNNQAISPPPPQSPISNYKIPPQAGNYNTQDPSSSLQAIGHLAVPPPPTTAGGPYDVANISKILKNFRFNPFLNTSIIKDEIKEEPTDTTELNGNNIFQTKLAPTVLLGNATKKKRKTKRKAPPPLTTVNTAIDIEAEIPCSSIKQRGASRKKPAKPRKNGAVPKEKPVTVVKQGSIRTTKRKTNYCEASSDDEPRMVINPKSRCTFQPIRPQPSEMLLDDIKLEIKDEPMEIGTEADAQVKVEDILDEIKDEPLSPVDIKDELMSPTEGLEGADIKPKRVRNPAAIAARNKNKLHPLTRKEQMMMNKLIQSKEPFLQNLPCLKLASRISKCRECRCASLRSDSVFCRFYDFRRLRYKENAILVVDGFSDPTKDPGPKDIDLWMPKQPRMDIDVDVCRYILMHVGDQFCRIWQEEQSAVEEHMSPNRTVAWKKVVKGVREICDVCETTLFNFHWTCSKCGFGVCLECYKDRKWKRTKKIERTNRGFDDYGWLVCTFREAHEQNTLMLTQIIPGSSLGFLAHRLHEVCKLWKIPQRCGCPLSVHIKEEMFTPKFVDFSNKIMKDAYLRFYGRECEIKYRERIKGLNPEDMHDSMRIMDAETDLIEEASAAGILPIILATTLKHLKRKPSADYKTKITLENVQDVVTMQYNALKTLTQSQRYLPQKVMTCRTSQSMFPGIDHNWLCNGKLLRLLDSQNHRNVLIFQEVWKRGQPVMVSEMYKFLNMHLWHPEAFCRDFGEKTNDLINCMTGNLVPNQPMKYFWEGFQCVSKRLLDADGEPMLLKLKDWPPGDDFAEILPTRFADLMGALPLPEYTLRTGTLNIASRLPSIFVPPDLGPKMYNAYGSALHPDKGTTNLHLDISDAVNIMVYVGIPTDASAKAQITAAMRAIDGGGCDIVTRRRVRQEGVMPGALWHIYSARDADKIRDLLNRVTIERGFRLEPDHDPIHDQNWYLDNELRERLYDDYGVEGYPIVQCMGDAVFIPAGAPHQVRNLHNCIKVAEDFVSPENIRHCFHLSQQFRKLSMSHTNHEDKLQIRNVIYHAVKDTTSYLTFLLNREL